MIKVTVYTKGRLTVTGKVDDQIKEVHITNSYSLGDGEFIPTGTSVVYKCEKKSVKYYVEQPPENVYEGEKVVGYCYNVKEVKIDDIR